MEAHYEAAHSHSPSPLLIFPFKKWGPLNIFAHSCLLSPDGGGWWGAGWHPYQLLRPDVDRITTCNGEYGLKSAKADLIFFNWFCVQWKFGSLGGGREAFVFWFLDQHGNVSEVQCADDVFFGESKQLKLLGCSYRGQHQVCQGQVWTAEVRWVLECWTLETWGSLASYPEYWTSPSGRAQKC